MIFKNNQAYIGQWRDNQFSGNGIFRFADGSVYNGTWLTGGQWNELRGYFSFFRTEKDAPTKMVVLERAGPGLTLVVDEVSIKPVALGGSTSSSLQV